MVQIQMHSIIVLDEKDNIISVNNYVQLVDAIERIKNYQVSDDFVINLLGNDTIGSYDATSNIIWANSSGIRKLTINGNGNTLNGLNKYQFMNIVAGNTLVLNNITLINYSASNGGVFLNYGNLTINNSALINNTALRDGGVFKSYNGTVIINNSVFTGNVATSYNGGVGFNDKGVLSVFNSSFTGNEAGYNGGVFLSTEFNY